MASGLPWLPSWEPPKEPRPPTGHPIEDHLFECEPSDIYEFFLRRPPSEDEADRLACEELRGRDRGAIFALIEHFRGR